MKTYTLNADGALSKYDYLWRLSSDRWAWEYLRRNKDFREDARTRAADERSEIEAGGALIHLVRAKAPQTLAERWGLVLMPDPGLSALEADAVWDTHAFPDQVEVHCTMRSHTETCEIFERTIPYCDVTHITGALGPEFLLLRGKGCVVQVRCTGHTLLGLAPVRMKLTISDLEAYEQRLKIQKEALAILGDGPDTIVPLWTKRTEILRNGLVALDCLDLGMSQREIANVLYGKPHVDADWEGPSMRNAIRYLIRRATALRDGGYLVELLGARPEPLWTAA